MLCFVWIMDVCDICRDVWIMDMNMIYIVFCVMESGCDVIHCVVCDEIWIWNAEMKKKISAVQRCHVTRQSWETWYPVRPLCRVPSPLALGKGGLFAECQGAWHSKNAASLPSAMCRHSAKKIFKKKLILCRVPATSALGKELTMAVNFAE